MKTDNTIGGDALQQLASRIVLRDCERHIRVPNVETRIETREIVREIVREVSAPRAKPKAKKFGNKKKECLCDDRKTGLRLSKVML